MDFARDVQPLLAERCLGCHGPGQQLGKLRLDRRDSALGHGRVVAGSSAYSLIYQRVAGLGGLPQMPPTGALPEPQIALLKTWIEQGAAWPDALAGPPETPPQVDAPVVVLRDALRRADAREARRIIAGTPKLGAMKGPGGDTALMYAALYRSPAAVRALLAAGADPNVANAAGATALMWATADLGVVRLLLDAGANPNAASTQQITALSVAAGRADGEAVARLLVDRGATPTPRAIVAAAAAGSEPVFRLLVDRGADLKAAPPMAMLQAVRTGCRTCLESLAQHANPNAMSLAMIGGAPFGDAAAMKLMLDRGGKVDATVQHRPDLTGRTPLIMAANSDGATEETVRLLLARGADVNFKGPDGETALELARRNGRTPIVDLLEQAGGRDLHAYAIVPLSPAPAASPRAAVARVLPLLQKSDVAFIDKTGCVSCHNNTLTTLTLAAARPKRIAFDETVERRQMDRVAALLENERNETLFGGQVTNTAAWLLVGLAAEGRAGDAATDAAVHSLLARQLPSGGWRNFTFDHRPPLQASDIDVTAAAIRALKVYSPPAYAEDGRRAVDRAAAWLRTASPRTSVDASMRLLGLRWAGAPGSDPAVRAGVRALLAQQRPDGGWAHIPSLDSDAYATGQALVALAEAGVRPSEPAYQRGVEFLRGSQQADGTWYVKTRSIPFQPHFESGFPYGRDQWISAAATNWAAQALLVAVR